MNTETPQGENAQQVNKLNLLQAAVAAKARYWDAVLVLEKALLNGGEANSAQDNAIKEMVENLASGIADPTDAYRLVTQAELDDLVNGTPGFMA